MRRNVLNLGRYSGTASALGLVLVLATAASKTVAKTGAASAPRVQPSAPSDGSGSARASSPEARPAGPASQRTPLASRSLIHADEFPRQEAATENEATCGVADIQFRKLFKPVGRRGLEYTDDLCSLDGRRVRIVGYVVRQSKPWPGVCLLTPYPLTLHEGEWGLAEDLPPATVHVLLSEGEKDQIVVPGRGPVMLTGVLSLDSRLEPDDRVSTVRLRLESSWSETARTGTDWEEPAGAVAPASAATHESGCGHDH
ncbi:MAG: hypothetical protein FLDDKLPJ_02981 [Phycisphaerae bacterium]|nr:hypothetical protein [Phycisphaerae bacterium]